MIPKPIDKMKILDIALENANKCKIRFTSTEEAMYGLNIEEQVLMLGLTYLILLSRQINMPKDVIKNIMDNMNTNCQSLATDIKRYREYSKRQIELINPTNQLRSEFTHQINAGQFDEALTTACKLIDLYEFGIAKSTINQKVLVEARKKYNDSLDRRRA